MIQGSINQLLTIAAAGYRMSDKYANKTLAADLGGKAKSAYGQLEAIYEGLNEEGKEYTETQLSDIESRTAGLNRNVYDAKIRSKSGDPLAKYLEKDVSKLPGQQEYTKLLGGIEGKLAEKRAALTPRERAEISAQQGLTDEQDRIRNSRESSGGSAGL